MLKFGSGQYGSAEATDSKNPLPIKFKMADGAEMVPKLEF